MVTDIRFSWGFMLEDGGSKMMQFYEILFDRVPEARALFSDIPAQAQKLSKTVGYVVSNIDNIESIKPAIEDLGRIHQRLNIERSYYPHVREALIETVKITMGDEYREHIGQSWRTALNVLSEIMINAPKEKKSPGLMGKIFGSKS